MPDKHETPVQSHHPRDYDQAIAEYWRHRGNEEYKAAAGVLQAAGLTVHEEGDGR